jgi:hypothetical protein
MKTLLKLSVFFVLCCLYCLLSLSAVYSQDFSSIGEDLTQLESLIAGTIESTEAQQKQLEDLKLSLEESGKLIEDYESIIAGHENLLRGFRTQLDEMSKIYREQSALSVTYEKSSRFWRTFTLLAVPAAALLSGGIVLGVCAGR